MLRDTEVCALVTPFLNKNIDNIPVLNNGVP
jgi:hypothetical protein